MVLLPTSRQRALAEIVERFGIANAEYRYIGIKISVNTGISSAFGVFLRKQIEQRNAGKNMF